MDRKGWKFALSNKTRQDFKEGKKVLFFFWKKKKKEKKKWFFAPFPLRKEESYWKGKHFRLGDGSLRWLVFSALIWRKTFWEVRCAALLFRCWFLRSLRIALESKTLYVRYFPPPASSFVSVRSWNGWRTNRLKCAAVGRPLARPFFCSTVRRALAVK